MQFAQLSHTSYLSGHEIEATDTCIQIAYNHSFFLKQAEDSFSDLSSHCPNALSYLVVAGFSVEFIFLAPGLSLLEQFMH